MMSRLWVIFLLVIGSAACAAGLPEALLIHDTSCVPVRLVAAWLGARVEYQAATGTASLVMPGATLSFKAQRDAATLNGKPLKLSRPVVVRGGQSFLPAAALTEAFGVHLQLHAATQQLQLRTETPPKALLFQLVRLNPIDGSELMWVPSGAFVMGSDSVEHLLPAGDFARFATFEAGGEYPECPAHQVNVHGYWMGRYEVTVAQYRQFCLATKRKAPAMPAARDRYPIQGVTWFEAAAYAKWAGGRLPTEAEWEKAGRASDGRVYPWGDQWNPSHLQILKRATADGLLPVGSFPAGVSPYGIEDLAGNVKEWCADWYDALYYASSPYENPAGPAAGSERVVRGGAWSGDPVHVARTFRCAYRSSKPPQDKAGDIGFRIVIPTQPSTPAINRPAIPFGRQAHADLLYAREFPAGYRCEGAWRADLNLDGNAEVVAIAVPVDGNPQPPILKIFHCDGITVAIADEYVFREQVAGAFIWRFVNRERAGDDPLPAADFGVRDLNADGKLEIYVILQSAGIRSYDAAMFVFHWAGKGQLTLVAQIPFPDAVKGAWIVDDLSSEHPGLEIVTVGRAIDEEFPIPFKPRRFVFTYYVWSGADYVKYQAKSTGWRYEDALQAILDPDW